MLPRGNKYSRGKFIVQKRDADGNTVGRTNNNPILDKREYRVEFDDGEVSKLTENEIAESMYSECNYSGNKYLMMESIVGYRKINKDLSVSSQKVVHRGRSFMQRYTVVWQLCVQWRDVSTSLQALKALKEYHTVDTAEYYVAQEIDHNLAFNWCVKPVLKKSLRIISLIKNRNARCIKKIYKFGIEVPKSVAQTYVLDKNNGNNLWADAIDKEMKDLRPAFKKL